MWNDLDQDLFAVGVRGRGGGEERERELAEMTGSLEAGSSSWKRRRRRRLGEWVFGSWLRELFARVLVAREAFIESARGF